MNAVVDLPDIDLLGAWAAAKAQRVRLYGRMVESGLRFAFYGRISTKDYQDPVSSRRWQFDFATELVAGHGRITAQFFDVGYSREVAWADRPEAARLLAAVCDPDRGFDAVVVGEYARAFYGSQAIHLAPLLRHHRVQLWLPEVDGPVDLANPTHQALLMLLGAQAKQEVQRARFRTSAAMQAQAREQGRHLGGRPPYGYRIVDAGPHPNSAHAAWGRRLHRLAPDLATAPWVKWIFARRLEGHAIARLDPPRLWLRLCWAAWRAGVAVIKPHDAEELPLDLSSGSRTPKKPYGHPDLLLGRAAAAGLITLEAAELISATRFGDTLIEQLAAEQGITASALRMRRRRAERVVGAAVKRGDLSGPVRTQLREPALTA